MSTIVTSASSNVASSAPAQRADVRIFGGIAAIIAAIVVISPVIVFGFIMPAFGLSAIL